MQKPRPCLLGAEELMDSFEGQMASVEFAEAHPASGGVCEGLWVRVTCPA